MFFFKLAKLQGMNKGIFFPRLYSCSIKPSKSFLYLGKKTLLTFCFNSKFITESVLLVFMLRPQISCFAKMLRLF